MQDPARIRHVWSRRLDVRYALEHPIIGHPNRGGAVLVPPRAPEAKGGDPEDVGGVKPDSPGFNTMLST